MLLTIPAMATLHSLPLSSPISTCPQPHHHLTVQVAKDLVVDTRDPSSKPSCFTFSGLISVSRIPCQSIHSSFNGLSLQLPPPQKPARITRSSRSHAQITMMVKPKIQFIQGTDEQTIPDVRLTKSRDGTNGVAIFSFEQPSVFDSSSELGDITGFFMIDEEGVLQSVDVSAKFVNGKPAKIEAKYVMRTPREWDRFMRFMERYSQANGLQFIKK